MHVLIVDDEILARQRLRRMLEAVDDCEVVGEAGDGDEALAAVERLDPDLVLMDVRMPGADGLSAARRIAQLAEPPALVFCTAYDQYALQAFDVDAVGYLVKPIQSEQLQALLDKASKLNRLQRQHLAQVQQQKAAAPGAATRQHISAKSRKGVELIALDSVYCFVADQKYVTVVHQGGETLIDETLKELEDEFAQRFVRIHRNALVAIDEIQGVQRLSDGHYQVKLKSSDYRPQVSRRHVAAVKALLDRL